MSRLAEAEYDFKRLRFGDIVSGTVVSVDPKEILIDIGGKSEGVVAMKELEKLNAEAMKKINVGDQLLAFVLKSENQEGHVVLSLERAQLETDWRNAEKVFKAGESFESQVAGFNKGGLIVKAGKVRGFVPATQLEGTFARKAETTAVDPNAPAVDLAAYVGKKIFLKIIEFDRVRNRLIMSERAAMREVKKQQKEDLLNSLKEGDVRSGTVTSVAEFGVFVSLGEVDGLIHLSELSWNKFNHPKDVVKPGDMIEVQVLSVDKNRERVALSLKRMQPEPWTTVEERYQVGQLVTATITKIAAFGAFARLDDNIEGLIHISELAERRIQHPKEVVKEGDTLTLRVIRVDAARRRLGLSLKRVADESDPVPSEVEMPEEEWPTPSDDEEPPAEN